MRCTDDPQRRKTISLISHSDVRYRGVLAGIDPAASTIQLSNGAFVPSLLRVSSAPYCVLIPARALLTVLNAPHSLLYGY